MATPTQGLRDTPQGGGTDGFEFVEYCSPDPEALGKLFEQMGFAAVARHRSKDVILYRHGDVNFILNNEPRSFAAEFTRQHGPSACAMAFRVHDAAAAFQVALERGATEVVNHVGPMELNIPTLQGIGHSRLYLVDRYGDRGTIYDVDFEPIDERIPGHGQDIDRLRANRVLLDGAPTEDQGCCCRSSPTRSSVRSSSS